MPSPYLPGPFLELDPESLAASGELNVDQLAALWNGEPGAQHQQPPPLTDIALLRPRIQSSQRSAILCTRGDD